MAASLGSPQIDDERLCSQTQLHDIFGGDNDSNALMYLGDDSNTNFDVHIDPLLDYGQANSLLTYTPPYFSAVSSLSGFREGIDQRIASIDAYFADPVGVLQRCKDDPAGEAESDLNPAAVLLTRTKQLTDIVQSLTSASPHQEQLNTETVLLALSSYLAFMRLVDSVFYRMYTQLSETPREMYRSIKVKSVLRIGGMSSLQDVPLKSYAIGVLDAIYAEVQTLEHVMGIPAEHCLSGQATAPQTATVPGLFARGDRARMFWTVMAQEDIESRRGSKSYAESARASVKDSMAFLVDT